MDEPSDAGDKPRELLVIQPLKGFTCESCGDESWDLVHEGDQAICLACADLDHLVFLPRGDTALTRRAKRASGLSAVVVRWSRSRKRYERQGLFVEEPALAEAEASCLADEDARARRKEREHERRANQDVEFTQRFAEEITALFPGCPARRAESIAGHAGARGSGRVGRSAAGRALDPQAVRLAVVASIRHEDTRYDSLLMQGVDRGTARDLVRDKVDVILDSWQRSR